MSQEEKFLFLPMLDDEWQDVADLIHHSTNSWYVANGKERIFKGPTSDALLFVRFMKTSTRDAA